MSVKKDSPQVLLVEGNDDQHVIWSLLQKYEIAKTFEVVDSKGIEKLLDQLPVRFKQSDIKTIGIVIDADLNIAARWHKLQVLLAAEGIMLPEIPVSTGTIVNGQIKFGVWIMPNNQLNGMLEDFIAFLVPDKDALMPIAIDTLNNIEKLHLNRYIPLHHSKALIHTWLAWQDDPGTPMGLAITKRYLTTDIDICTKFLDWIRILFS